MDIDFEQASYYASMVWSLVMEWVPTILWALATLIIWLRAIKHIGKIAAKWFTASKMDITVSKFLVSLITAVLKILLVISVAGMFWVQTTSFIAILWAAWLAIWMALQGSLSNFAGWVLNLIFKPYEVGDLIETEWVFWKVTDIEIFVTKLLTPDNKIAIIPNGPIANGNIINYSKQWEIRVDVAVWIAYDEDIDNTRAVLTKVIEENPFVINNHSWNWIFVNELADSSVNLIVRWYVKPQSYRDAFFTLTEQSKKALDSAGISIPFPHRVIHTSTETL